MAEGNHSFSDDDQTYPTPTPGFSPGGEDFGVIRMVDGHDPWAGGSAGANVHRPSAGRPSFGPPVGQPVEELNDTDG